MKKILFLLFIATVSVNVSNAQCIPVACTYSSGSTSFSLSPVGTNSVTQCDDCLSGAIPLGFNFGYMCNSYNSILIGSNGFITFNLGNTASGCCSGGNIPSASQPAQGIVALFWTDLYNSNTNSITYGTFGTAPNRIFVVTYSAVPICCGTTFPHTGQIKLFENNGVIEMHMANVPNSGNTVTQGICNVAGTVGYTTNVMAGSGFSTTNTAVRYTPITTNTAVTIPFPPTIISAAAVCITSALSFTANGLGATSYSWSVPGTWAGGTGTTSVINPTVTAAGVVTVSATYSCGTSAPATMSVSYGSPTVSVNSGSVCSGNNFTITPSGASTYTIQGGSAVVSPTAPATFTIIGSNAGCVSANTATSSVGINPSPTITASGNTPICGGTATNVITASGASTYTWNTGATTSSISVSPTVTTTYTVTGTNASGCNSSYTLSQNLAPNPTITVNSGGVCAGSSFTMVPSGASTYTFSSGSAVVTPTVGASYSVTGTSSLGCVGSNTAVSSVSISPIPTITVNNGTICAGKSFTIVPSGANTYAFSGGSAVVTPTTNTSYIVTGTNTLTTCSNTAISSVTVNALPNVSLTASSNTSCVNGTIIPLNASPPGGTFAGANVAGNIFTPGPTAGTFNPTYSYTNSVTGCSKTATVTIVVSICTGIVSLNANNTTLNVYPNPTNGVVTVELSVNSKVIVTNILGEVVLTNTLNAGKQTIDISNQSNGIYFVRFSDKSKEQTIKLIKE